MSHTNIAVKRIQKELQFIHQNPSNQYHAQSIDNELFIWHFTIRGPQGSPYENGIYHGQMEFPTDYPIKPPNIQFFTPNGRYEINLKICLSMTNYHPEQWNPAWTIDTMLKALISTFPDQDSSMMGFGSISGTSDERIKLLANKSREFVCEKCGKVQNLFNWENIEKEKIIENNLQQNNLNQNHIEETQEQQKENILNQQNNNIDEKNNFVQSQDHFTILENNILIEKMKLDQAIEIQKMKKKQSICLDQQQIQQRKQSSYFLESEQNNIIKAQKSIDEQIIKSYQIYHQVLESINFVPNPTQKEQKEKIQQDILEKIQIKEKENQLKEQQNQIKEQQKLISLQQTELSNQTNNFIEQSNQNQVLEHNNNLNQIQQKEQFNNLNEIKDLKQQINDDLLIQDIDSRTELINQKIAKQSEIEELQQKIDSQEIMKEYLKIQKISQTIQLNEKIRRKKLVIKFLILVCISLLMIFFFQLKSLKN